jgi:probable HAF family extracellular repeat protein
MSCRDSVAFALAASSLSLLAVAQVQAAPPRYTVTNLGAFGSFVFPEIVVNNSGQVAFTSREEHAVIYRDGVMTDLGTFGADFVDVRAINDNGQLVGLMATFSPDYSLHAFLYGDGTLTDLGTLEGGHSEAWDVNDRGQVVGISYNYSPGCAGELAFLYSDGQMTDLGMVEVAIWPQFGARSWPARCAYGINNSGQIVGVGNDRDAFLYSNRVMTDLRSLGIGECLPYPALAINDSGEIAGTLYIDLGEGSYTSHAFLYSDGVTTDLGTLGRKASDATAINASGQVVGNFATVDSGHGFLFSDGVMHDLRSLAGQLSDWIYISPTDINDRGWITGHGLIDGEYCAFLLTPVPEPSAALLAAIGLAGWLALARPRRKISPGGAGG